MRVTLSVCLFAAIISSGRAAVVDFESLGDGEIVTTQFPGLTFSNAAALTAGISLNEFEFPPRSGSVVVSDNGGPIEIAFATPVVSFAGYFTYVVPLTLTAFDALDNPVDVATSLFSTNLALSGDAGSSPNERLDLAALGIARVTIAGDSGGGSFTLDDAEYTQAAIPEPSAFSLIALGGIVLATFYQHSRKRHIA